MINWRERARAIRGGEGRRHAGLLAALQQPETCPPAQVAFAKRIIDEVLVPVLGEFVGILTDKPGKVVYHEHDSRTFAVTCDMDARRFTAKVYLLPGSMVRVAVFLTPSHTEGACKDYGPEARNEEIERWFGNSLARLYEYR